MNAKKLNGFGFRKACRGCPKWTANAGGFCTACLDGGVPDRPPAPSKHDLLRIARRLGRAAHAILSRDARPSDSVPAAVLRGRGVLREACHS